MKKISAFLFIIICLLELSACSSKEVDISCDDVYMMIGQTYTLNPTSNIENAKYQYTTNTNIFTLDGNKIEAKSAGTATLSITAKGLSGSKDINIHIYEEGLAILGDDKIEILESQTLTLLRFDVDEDEKIVWRSSDIHVLKVQQGVVSAVDFGTATITAKSEFYEYSFTMEVIRPKVSKIDYLDTTDFEVGATYNLKYDVLPFYALKDISIEVSNDNLKVNRYNSVTAIKEGNTELTLKAIDNEEVIKVVNINILANEAPVFEKLSDYSETLVVNYADGSNLLQGLNVSDNVDYDIASSLSYNQEDLQYYGMHDIKLTISDHAGNKATFTRKIYVVWNYHTKFIGHAGCTYYVPNSYEAFLYAAKELHYQALECDLHVTKDGIYVTHHDSTINGLSISENTLETLQKQIETQDATGYPKQYGLNNTSQTGTLCTLEDYLKICKQYGCIAVIELKGSSPGLSSYSQAKIPALCEYIKSQGMWENTIFLTSMQACLKAIRENGYTDVRCQYLVNSADSQEVLDFCIQYNCDLSTNVTYGGSNTDEWLAKYHAAGLEISVWTFDNYNDYDLVQKWIDKGVEYVTCDWHVMSELDLK